MGLLPPPLPLVVPPRIESPATAWLGPLPRPAARAPVPRFELGAQTARPHASTGTLSWEVRTDCCVQEALRCWRGSKSGQLLAVHQRQVIVTLMQASKGALVAGGRTP